MGAADVPEVRDWDEVLEWPFFDDGHRRLAVGLRRWTADNGPLLDAHPRGDAELDAACRRLVREMGRAGWLRHCVPEPGGGGRPLDVRALCLARDILARASGLADFAFAMQGLGTGPISLFGDEALKRRYLPRVAAGEATAAFAISEPDAGSDVAAMTTTAVRDGPDYVIDGLKTWISNAGLADHYVVFARTGEQPGARGLSAFVVEADTPGLSVDERIELIAPHPLGTVRLDGCRVPAARMVGGPGQGFRVAMGTLDVFRSTVGAAALGFARRALDEAAGRAARRRVFGKPLSEFQLTQARLADMAVSVEAAALLVYRAAWAKDRDITARATRQASMAKLYATEAAQQVIDGAVQLFGGLGVVAGNPAAELYREIRALRIYEGTSEVQKLVIADAVLKAAAGSAPVARAG